MNNEPKKFKVSVYVECSRTVLYEGTVRIEVTQDQVKNGYIKPGVLSNLVDTSELGETVLDTNWECSTYDILENGEP